jgi:hypothetical protein
MSLLISNVGLPGSTRITQIWPTKLLTKVATFLNATMYEVSDFLEFGESALVAAFA